MYLILGYVEIIPVLYTTSATPQNHMNAQRPCCFGCFPGKDGSRKRVVASPVPWQISDHVRTESAEIWDRLR